MPDIVWEQLVAFGVQIRVRLQNDGCGNTLGFVVQLEYWDGQRWCPVVRYDTAHGQPHVDYLDPRGREYRKDWIDRAAPYNDLVNAILVELRASSADHINRFLEQKGG